MRLSLRFVVPLAIALAAIAYAVVPLVDRLTLRWFVRDLDIRAALIANALQEPVQDLARSGAKARLEVVFDKITQDERLFAIGFCDAADGQLVASPSYPSSLRCEEVGTFVRSPARLLESSRGPLHVSVKELKSAEGHLGRLVLIHDMSFVRRRTEETKRYVFYFFVALGAVVSLITVVIAQLSWRGWLQGMRALLRGEGLLRPAEKINLPELRPFAKDVRTLVRDLQTETRARDESQIAWSPEALRRILREDLRGEDVVVVSNREPYIHVYREGAIEVQRPASGLVTALEPVMRACSGVWIAHGGGAADRESVDQSDSVAVPPEHPIYRLRRVWLAPEEESGYYYGFANEGLWPLCHIAHVRPTFRSGDWAHYVAVNERFASIVREEAKTDDPIVLVQDYHFALLPRLIRDRLPRATIIAFWHIPWPNPEAFSICPWGAELLDGLLGSSILGFHTQSHCNNFMDTVDRQLEARVDRELFTVTYRRQPTAVRRYPISIEWPPAVEVTSEGRDECRSSVRRRHALGPEAAIGVGVDRLDYTKGILERFRAVERLLEIEPRWIGKFTFMQIAAPSRTRIERYQDFGNRVRALADEINGRFGRDDYVPIVLTLEHREPRDVYEYYRACELCFVSSLHDGMNLVAKEFVAARDDEQGVLILSRFTGASRELPEALIVNPYDIDQCAAAMHVALTMAPAEQRHRMRSMRALVKEFNVYRWAGRMLLDAAMMRRRGRLLAADEDSEPALGRRVGVA